MAIPAILGSGAILGVLTELFSKLLSFFTRRFSAGIAIQLTWVVAYVASVLAMASTMAALLSNISMVIPAPLADGFAMANPGNLEVCLSAYYSARVAVWLNDHRQRIADQQARALMTKF